jgi:nitroreductase
VTTRPPLIMPIRLLKHLAMLLPPSTRDALRLRYRTGRDRLGVWKASCHDASWYCRHSGLGGSIRKGVLQARIIKSYHRVEKGLALASPRPGFGPDAISLLIRDIEIYRKIHGTDHVIHRAIQTLAEYDRFNQLADLPSDAAQRKQSASQLTTQPEANIQGGTIEVSRTEILAAAQHDLSAFFQHRYSIRQFSATPVDEGLIERAVRMAQKTPSVCNRESGRVFLVSEKACAAKLLAFQNGNRGFGEQADKLLIITASVDCFLTVGERNQCWIDGGLFSMSVIYALHSLGLGTCCLNWSVEPATDRSLKRSAGIPENHAIIMMLAVGHLPEKLRVAASARRPLADVLSRL